MVIRIYLIIERSVFVGVEFCNICFKEEVLEFLNKYLNLKFDEYFVGEFDL